MHHEFAPDDDPGPDAEFGVPAHQITTELFGLCEEFLRQASPAVHAELRRFLDARGYRGDLGWFIDALGITTRTTLDE